MMKRGRVERLGCQHMLLPSGRPRPPVQGYSVLNVTSDPFGDVLVSRGGLLSAAAVFIVVEDDVLRLPAGLKILAIASFLRS